jgi:cytochrome c553
MGCHSPSGEGNGPAAWPALKSQHPEYIVAQLQAFRQGARANDPGRMMRDVSARMSDAEMQSVANYIAGVQ